MKIFSVFEEPFRVFGNPHFYETRSFERLPAEIREAIPTLEEIGKRPTGTRIGFRTDSEHITLRMEFEPITVSPGMSIHSSASSYIFVGERTKSRYAGLIGPEEYGATFAEKTVRKSANMEEVLIILPRNTLLKKVEIGLDDHAKVEAPTPYLRGPVVFYGSSIVENSCPAVGYNAYPQLVSRFLDCDYYNFGFSGNARGELPIADYILTLPMKAFVLDYDYNADTHEFLMATHEPFFLRIRERMPDLPILMMSRPNFDFQPEKSARRRNIVYQTYQNAIKRGDKKVWFIDGETLFGDTDREICTVDMIHPNDLGFYRMAKTVAPVLMDMLDGKENR